jgi:hypothetical protein
VMTGLLRFAVLAGATVVLLGTAAEIPPEG